MPYVGYYITLQKLICIFPDFKQLSKCSPEIRWNVAHIIGVYLGYQLAVYSLLHQRNLSISTKAFVNDH
jgi:hypothetical protein